MIFWKKSKNRDIKKKNEDINIILLYDIRKGIYINVLKNDLIKSMNKFWYLIIIQTVKISFYNLKKKRYTEENNWI